MIEHTIYWERHSINDLIEACLRNRLPASAGQIEFEVADPIAGKL